MKILVYSDLHLEFEAFEPPALDVDLVVLAGDIGKGVKAVEWAGATFTGDVLFVGGNHEYYGGHIDRTWEKMQQAAAPHVHLLDNQSFVSQNVRFLGATCWTDFTLTNDPAAASRQAWEWMNDYRKIRAGDQFRRLRPDDVIVRNRASFEWLTGELATPFSGKTFVITHHAPLPQVTGDKHDGHLNASYANNWPRLVEQAHVWVFGHTHQAIDVEILGCRVISNPKGYPSEATGFDPGFVIEI